MNYPKPENSGKIDLNSFGTSLPIYKNIKKGGQQC